MKTVEANKAVTRAAIEEIWNQHNLDAIDVLFAPNYVNRGQGAHALAGREDFKRLVSQATGAAPNARFSIAMMVAQGDKVAVRYSASNGHGVTAAGSLVLRIIHSQIRESWGASRMAELLRRVGGAA